jgi:hypothetical protein
VLEAAYGALCYLTARPGVVSKTTEIDIEPMLHQIRVATVSLSTQRLRVLRDLAAAMPRADAPVDCQIHGFADIEDGFVVGEYGEGSARVYLKTDGRYSWSDPYGNDPRVRHIHAVFRHRGDVFVSTGDAHKYLDRYSIERGDLRFRDRVIRLFGGFTAGCSVRDQLFLGTDFSGRPNYILCLETGRKFWFPRPAYNQQCSLMVPLRDRHIVCINAPLMWLGRQLSVSVFDADSLQFIYCRHCNHADVWRAPDEDRPADRLRAPDR